MGTLRLPDGVVLPLMKMERDEKVSLLRTYSTALKYHSLDSVLIPLFLTATM